MMGQDEKFKEAARQIRALMKMVIAVIIAISACLIYLMIDPNLSAFSLDSTTDNYVLLPEVNEEDFDKIENGIHVRTGFVDDKGLMTVVNNCTNCHSAKLVTQNRMSKERWTATIRWMQETQNLWDLGKNEEIIVNYLATNYAPTKKGRRQSLINVEWYELE